MAFKVIKRCIRCRKPLREDGTCQNPKCVRYTEPKEKEESTPQETTLDGSTPSTGDNE